MNQISKTIGCVAVFAVVVTPTWAIFGVGDIVFDPTAAIKWAAQAEQMAQQIQQMTTMVQNANTIISYAGNPKDAIKSFSDLSRISQSMANIVGPGATADELIKASAYFNDVNNAQVATENLMNSINGLNSEVSVFGSPQKRHQDFYAALSATEQISMQTRAYLSKTAKQRADIQQKLDETWTKLHDPGINESQKANLMAQITQLQSQIMLLDGQQNATVTDMQLETDKRVRQQEMKNVGLQEQAQLEGEVMSKSLSDRKQAVDKAQEASLSTEPQVSPDWSTAIRTYWAPPENADSAGQTRK
jgi:hypothetical protein